MKPISIFLYIHLGALHWNLVRLSGSINDIKGESGVLPALLDLKQHLVEAGLPVTLAAGWKLWELAAEIEKDQKLENISPEMSIKISKLAYSIEPTLIAESSGKIAYLITDKRLDIEKLLHNQSALLAPDIFNMLPAICVNDFLSACKSIAYELPTAAAFHILRCAEGTLRHFYLGVIKQKRLQPGNRTWGAMVLQMRRKKTNSPPVELLDTLDNIRINFRNPTNHPEKIFDIEEVQDLFGLCVDAINRMVKTVHWIMPEDSLKSYHKAYLEKSKKESDAA